MVVFLLYFSYDLFPVVIALLNYLLSVASRGLLTGTTAVALTSDLVAEAGLPCAPDGTESSLVL